MKKISNKGFTLIEIVIVIVIIAILAAILVPALTNWIDKARLASLKSEADTIRLSVVAGIDHEFSDTVNDVVITDSDVNDDFWNEISKMANVELSASNVTFTINKGSLIDLTYSKGKHTATYDNGEWSYE